MEQLDSVHEIAMLLDFYGNLLSQRQQEIMQLHYNDDCSLAEISQMQHISRQGVYDNIRRAKNALRKYEANLGLVNKFYTIKEMIAKNVCALETLDQSVLSERNKQIIKEICKDLEKINNL